jgi:hypothetical protein
MPTCRTDLERRLFTALKRITCYETAARLLKHGDCGLPGPEALEMAYENVLEEAKRAVKGVRMPKPPKQIQAAE